MVFHGELTFAITFSINNCQFNVKHPVYIQQRKTIDKRSQNKLTKDINYKDNILCYVTNAYRLYDDFPLINASKHTSGT